MNDAARMRDQEIEREVAERLRRYDMLSGEDAVQHVYLAQCGDVYKIGVSVNPDKRVQSIQTGNPARVILIAHCPSHDKWLEKALHRAYAYRRVRGEWFKLTEDEAQMIADAMRAVSKALSPNVSTRGQMPPQLRRGSE